MNILTRVAAHFMLPMLCLGGLPAIATSAQPSPSRPVCETDGDYEPPAETMRAVELPDLGVVVSIPENYRAMKLQSGAVQILHPDDFEWIQCLVRGGTGAHGYYSETIDTVPPESDQNLEEQAAWTVGYSYDEDGNREPGATEVIPHEENGFNGYIATSMTGYSVVFLGTMPESDELLRVSAGCDCEVETEAVTDLLSRIRPLDEDEPMG